MRKIIAAVLVVVLLTSGLLVGCGAVTVTGSGNLKTKTFDFSDFTGVKAESGFQVELTKSSTFSIEITADDNVLEDIEVDKSGDTLRIRPQRNRIYRSVTFRANITMPDLYKIDLSGGSRASITGFNSSHDLSVGLSGGSAVTGDITAGDADLNLSGGSQVALSGAADNLDVNGSGGSHLELEDFSVNNADVNLSGGGRATVNVNGTLDVNLSGGSRVTYIGEPTMGDIDLSGDSTISKDEHAETRAALQGLIDQQVKEQDILGMAMAVRLADGTVIGKASGYTDPSGEESWSVNTVSAIGSVTKTFTALVVMQLVEEGKISLDDTIDTWFPEQPNGDRITIRMLLSHTSGIANYISIENVMEGKWNKEWAPMDLVAEANKSGPVGEPGSSEAHYSNTNYVLLGLIVEDVTGNKWAQEVESRIIKPLDLKDTMFISTEGVWGGILVEGYTKTPDGYISSLELPWYPHPSTVWSAGEVVSTVSDMMTFASALFDGKLVSRETLAVMAQPVGTDVNYGLLWGLGGGTIEEFGPEAFLMAGDIPGYHAFFIGVLDTKFVVTALVNIQEGDVIMPGISAIQYISGS